LSHH